MGGAGMELKEVVFDGVCWGSGSGYGGNWEELGVFLGWCFAVG